ncbi:MAG: hypothetical protein ACRDJU_01960 [Actinomycetota bacterium]
MVRYAPGVPVLYPMGVGQLIDASIKIYRRNWKTFIAIVAWLLVPLAFLQAFALRNAGGFSFTLPSNQANNPSAAFSTIFPGNTVLVLLGFYLLLFLIVTPFLTAAVALATADLYLGREVTVGSVYRASLRRFHSILWVLILNAVVISVGLVLLIVPGLFFAVRFIMAPVIVVLETKRGTKALGRAWRLSIGNFWRMLSLGILTFLIVELVDFIVALIPDVIGALTGNIGWVFRGFGASAGMVIATPFTTIALTLLYFDLRIRKEAFDLSILAGENPDPAQP